MLSAVFQIQGNEGQNMSSFSTLVFSKARTALNRASVDAKPHGQATAQRRTIPTKPSAPASSYLFGLALMNQKLQLNEFYTEESN